MAEGTPSEKIILGGFSQGGVGNHQFISDICEGAALSLYTGTQSKVKLGGIIALSGYLPRYKRFEEKVFIPVSSKYIPYSIF